MRTGVKWTRQNKLIRNQLENEKEQKYGYSMKRKVAGSVVRGCDIVFKSVRGGRGSGEL